MRTGEDGVVDLSVVEDGAQDSTAADDAAGAEVGDPPAQTLGVGDEPLLERGLALRGRQQQKHSAMAIEVGGDDLARLQDIARNWLELALKLGTRRSTRAQVQV